MKEYNWKEEQKKTQDRSLRSPRADKEVPQPPDTFQRTPIYVSRTSKIFYLLGSVATIIGVCIGGYRLYWELSKYKKTAVEPPTIIVAPPVVQDDSDIPAESDIPSLNEKKFNITIYSVPEIGGCQDTFCYNPLTQKYEFENRTLFSNKPISENDIKKNKEYRNFKLAVQSTYDYFARECDFNSYNGDNADLDFYLGWSCYYSGGDKNHSRYYPINSAACPYLAPDGKYSCHFIIGRYKTIGSGEKRAQYPLKNHPQSITHEYMHGITSFLVNNGREYLIYEGESGALDEALSDIFACLHAIETKPDMPDSERWLFAGGLRNLKDPHSVSNLLDKKVRKMPAYYLEKDCWYSGSDDNGGVHHNMSVPGKMASLLCDGGTFRGENITPMGAAKVRRLFWQLVSSHRMTVTQNFKNLAQLLYLAAVDINFTLAEQKNVLAACRAVNLPHVPSPDSGQNNLTAFANNEKMSGLMSMLNHLEKLSGEKIGDTKSFRNAFANYELADIRQKTTLSGTTFSAFQKIANIPVFASSAVILTNKQGKVSFFSRNFSEHSTPSAATPREMPRQVRKNLLARQQKTKIIRNESVYYDPVLLGRKGDTILAWKVQTGLAEGIPLHCYLIDQKTEKIVFDYPLNTATPDGMRKNDTKK